MAESQIAAQLYTLRDFIQTPDDIAKTMKRVKEIGYDAVYISGGVMANDLGFPDIGLTTLQDVSTRSYLISRVTNLPTIVDIDTGFKSCKETIETFEEFGITGVHLEDQIERKRCGHLDNKELITTEAMVNKIKECVKTKKDKNFSSQDAPSTGYLICTRKTSSKTCCSQKQKKGTWELKFY